MAKKQTIETPVGRASWAHVIEPGENTTKKGKPKYEITLLIPKADSNLKPLRTMVRKCAEKEWGEINDKSRVEIKGKMKKIRWPFKNGDKLYEEDPEVHVNAKGCWVLDFQSVQKPGIVDVDGATRLTTVEEFYSGCWCCINTHCFAWENDKGGIGVSFGMNGIQKVRNDQSFVGGPPVEEMFESKGSVDDGESGDDDDLDMDNADSSGDADDEIEF